MKAKIAAIVLTATLVLIAPACVFAQYETNTRMPLGIGVSAMVPFGTELQDLKSVWTGATLYWNATFDELDRPNLMVSVAWLSESSGPTSARVIPIKATYIKRFGEEEACWYVGAGVDLYYAKYAAPSYYFDVEQFNTTAVMTTDSGLVPGVNLVVGREFGGGWFAEIRDDFVSKLSHGTGGHVDFSGWSLSLGSRAAF